MQIAPRGARRTGLGPRRRVRRPAPRPRGRAAPRGGRPPLAGGSRAAWRVGAMKKISMHRLQDLVRLHRMGTQASPLHGKVTETLVLRAAVEEAHPSKRLPLPPLMRYWRGIRTRRAPPSARSNVSTHRRSANRYISWRPTNRPRRNPSRACTISASCSVPPSADFA